MIGTVCVIDFLNKMPILPFLYSFFTSKLTWKNGCILCFLLILFLIFRLYAKNEELHNSNNAREQLRSENERYKADLKLKLDVQGLSTDQNTTTQRNASDFVRDWDISGFNIVDGDTFCPKERGKNNFQRITYKYETQLTATDLDLKFRMVDQDIGSTDYTQRIVVGMKLDETVFSEYDIPTRDNQVINFRVASEDGRLVSGGEGKSISSLIKDKSIINLKFQTKLNHGQEVTQIIGLDYISGIDEYGDESKSISYDAKVNDPRPETTRANLFIGSYVGGCIKIINWHAS